MAFSKKKDVYQAHPDDMNRMLSKVEIVAILDAKGAGFVKDKRKVMHFVERTLYTIKEAGHKQRTLDRTNMELRAQLAAKSEYASSMDPQQALKYVDPVILAQHADHAAKLLSDRAQAEAQEMESRMTDVQMEVLNALETPGIEPGTEKLLRRILGLLSN